jgi:hypothetical protein
MSEIRYDYSRPDKMWLSLLCRNKTSTVSECLSSVLGFLSSVLKQTTNLELLISGLKSPCCEQKNCAYGRPFRHKRERYSRDAWLNTVTLLDILHNIRHISQCYDFQEVRNKITKFCVLAESQAIDKKNMKCLCGLSDGEHALLKRNMMRSSCYR